MLETTKISAIIQTWLDYIQLEELTNAEVDAGSTDDDPHIWDKDINLLGNHLFLTESLFKELKQEYKDLKEQNKSDDFKIAVAFPQIYQIKDRLRKFRPLFTLDISIIFAGNYQKSGWDLTKSLFQPVLPNLMDLYGLSEDEAENLVIREGLLVFLETTFNHPYKDLQDFLNLIDLPPRPLRSKASPYLLRFDYAPYSYNLKKDLQKICSQPQWDWATPSHPAYEYLFGVPKPPSHEVFFLGAFPTNPPTPSQALALKHALLNPITAVMGPPGNGKTSTSLHKIAQQIVKRAYKLITSGLDESNLTLVTSTNNRAVNNVEERLAADISTERFYLSGGSKNLIDKQVLPKLQAAINWLEQADFDEQDWSITKNQLLTLANELTEQKKQYDFERQQQQQDEQLLNRLSEEIEELETAIRNFSYSSNREEGQNYTSFPVNAYEQILPYVEKAIASLPSAESSSIRSSQNVLVRLWNWLRSLWLSLTQSSERHILKRLYKQIEVPIAATLATPFPFQMPLTRESLLSAREMIVFQLNRQRESTQAQLDREESTQQQNSLTTQRDSHLRRIEQLQNRLANYATEDFYDIFYIQFHAQQQQLFTLSWQYLQLEALKRKEEVMTSLKTYMGFLSQDWNARWALARNWRTIYRDLSLVFPVLISTLHSVRNLIPYPDTGCLDQVIFDEAAMSPQHQAFPVLVRTRQAFIVGDPWQLEPVIPFSQETLKQYASESFLKRGLTDADYDRYSPTSHCTAYHRAAGASGEQGDIGMGILLKEHYRCVPPIIKYSDRICHYGIDIKTPDKPSALGANLIAYHVEGKFDSQSNVAEIEAIEAIIDHLLKQGYCVNSPNNDSAIGVISPYRHQANALNKKLHSTWDDFSDNSIGTIHTFQGGEKSVIILSTRQSLEADSLWFINRRPNLLNVAVSRAKELFILVGDLERLKEGGYTRMLVEHIEEYGEMRELPQSFPQDTRKRSKASLSRSPKPRISKPS